MARPAISSSTSTSRPGRARPSSVVVITVTTNVLNVPLTAEAMLGTHGRGADAR